MGSLIDPLLIDVSDEVCNVGLVLLTILNISLTAYHLLKRRKIKKHFLEMEEIVKTELEVTNPIDEKEKYGELTNALQSLEDKSYMKDVGIFSSKETDPIICHVCEKYDLHQYVQLHPL